MKKKLILIGATVAMLALSSFTIYESVKSQDNQGSMVYVCTGSKSKRYHKTNECKGLSKCSGSIKKVTIEEAKRMNRTPCKICY